MEKVNGYSRKWVVTIVAAWLLIFLYFIIWGFSAQDSEESGSLSMMISEKCVEIINAFTARQWTDVVKQEMAEYFQHPIRKLAHFSEYACMGVLLYILWRQWKEKNRRLYVFIVIWVFLSAALDEFHQTFVPGRYGCFPDVLLDTCGGAFSVLLCRLMDRGKPKEGH